MISPRIFIPVASIASATIAPAQNPVALDFSDHVQNTNGQFPNGSSTGTKFYDGTVFDFRNVASIDGRAIDARVSLEGISGDYGFDGWIPGYNGPLFNEYGQPDNALAMGDDLGLYYFSTPSPVENSGGISWTLTFYEGGGGFETITTLSEISLLLYDHDGEPGQSETIRAYLADGLAGYQIVNGSGITAAGEGDAFRFDARSSSHTNYTAEGGFLLNYRNVSTVHLDMLATTQPWLPAANNGIFHAVDGNQELAKPTDLGVYQAVPEPTAAMLGGVSALLFAFRRKRPRK